MRRASAERLGELQLDDAALQGLIADARRWIAHYAGPRSDLDDLVQEAMVELVVALESFRGESSVRTFAHRVVLRTTARELQRRRRTSREVMVQAVPSADDLLDPERALAGRRSLARFYVALDGLSDKLRRAFVLCAIEQLSHQEAADVEGVNLETLRARLKRARAVLEEALARDQVLATYSRRSQ